VDGLTPSPGIAFDAIACVQQNGGQLQQQHPTAANYFVDGYEVGPCGDQKSPSQTSVWVTVFYVTSTATGNFVLVEIMGSHGQEDANRWTHGDQKGEPVLIGWNNDRTKSFADQIDPFIAIFKTGGDQFDTVCVPVASHNTIIRFTRREVGSPLANVEQFRQSINSTPWYGYAPGMVLCRDISAHNLIAGSIIAPTMYEVVYEMEIAAYSWGWQRVEFFKDEHTGKPLPCKIANGNNNGYTKLVPYPSQDFTTLKLPDPRKGSGPPLSQ